jgi:hypothetical protein
LFHTDRANHTWNSGSASHVSLFNGWHDWSAAFDICADDDISSSDRFFYAYGWRHGHTPYVVRTTSQFIHDRFSRLDRTGAAAARTTAPTATFHYCSARTGVIDATEHGLPIHAGHHSHDYGIGTDDVTDCDGASSRVGDHSHANRHHHDREHFASGSAWWLLDHRMQLYAGRAADQWRRFGALDAGNSGEPTTRYDSAGRRAAWRHQYRSDSGSYANAEHIGMRGKRHDESGDARHDGIGQRHGCRGDARRIAGGLLTG